MALVRFRYETSGKPARPQPAVEAGASQIDTFVSFVAMREVGSITS